MKSGSRPVKRHGWLRLPWPVEASPALFGRFQHSHPPFRFSRVGTWTVGVTPMVIFER